MEKNLLIDDVTLADWCGQRLYLWISLKGTVSDRLARRTHWNTPWKPRKPQKTVPSEHRFKLLSQLLRCAASFCASLFLPSFLAFPRLYPNDRLYALKARCIPATCCTEIKKFRQLYPTLLLKTACDYSATNLATLLAWLALSYLRTNKFCQILIVNCSWLRASLESNNAVTRSRSRLRLRRGTRR